MIISKCSKARHSVNSFKFVSVLVHDKEAKQLVTVELTKTELQDNRLSDKLSLLSNYN